MLLARACEPPENPPELPNPLLRLELGDMLRLETRSGPLGRVDGLFAFER